MDTHVADYDYALTRRPDNKADNAASTVTHIGDDHGNIRIAFYFRKPLIAIAGHADAAAGGKQYFTDKIPYGFVVLNE